MKPKNYAIILTILLCFSCFENHDQIKNGNKDSKPLEKNILIDSEENLTLKPQGNKSSIEGNHKNERILNRSFDWEDDEEIAYELAKAILPDVVQAPEKLSEISKNTVNQANEIINKRNRTSKHYLRSDGITVDAILSPSSLHYLDENDKWKEISTEVIPSHLKDYVYQNTTNNLRTWFSSNLDEYGVLIRTDEMELQVGKNLSVSYKDRDGNDLYYEKFKKTIPEVENSTVIYKNVLPNISNEYKVMTDQLKQNVILEHKPVMPLGSEIMAINEDIILPDGYTMQMDQIGYGLVILDESGNNYLHIPTPQVYELNNETVFADYNEAYFSFERVNEQKNLYRLSTKVSTEWLNQHSYPIVIDPTLELNGGFSGYIRYFYDYRDPGCGTPYTTQTWQPYNNAPARLQVGYAYYRSGRTGSGWSTCSYSDSEFSNYRSWIKYDTSTINEPILGVEFSGNIASSSGSSLLGRIYSSSSEGGNYTYATNSAQYNSIIGGDLHGQASYGGVGQKPYVVLNNGVETRLQNLLSSGYFQLGFDHNGSSRYSTPYHTFNTNESLLKVTYGVSCEEPVASCQNGIAQLDAFGNVTISVADIDSGSTAECGLESMTLSQTNFTCADVGENVVTLTVTDVNGAEATCQATVKVEDNVDPNAIAQDITVQLDATGNVSIVPGDIDNDATPSNDACGIQSLALDITAFDCDDVGPNPVILMVTDVNGNVSTAQATVTVIDSIDPVIVGENNNLTINFDAGSGAPASYTEDGVTFLSLYGSSSHVHLGDNDGDGSNDISNHDSCCSTPYRLTVGSGVEFTLASMEVKAISGSPYFEVYPNGPTVNVTQTGTFNFPASFANATEIRWHQNSGRMTIDNMVVSTETTGSCPSDIVVESDTENCGSNVTYSASATDNCTASVTFSPPSGSFFEIGTHTVTLTVSDSSNNTTSCQFTVTVEDNVLPNALAQDVTVQLDATGNVSIVPGDIDNDTTPSNDACGIQGLSLDVTAFGCGDVGDNPVVLTVTDNNGNQSTANATVTVEDNVDPNAIAQDITVQLDATGNVSIVPGDIDNDTTPSNDACGIQGLSLDVTAFGCGDVGDNPVILTVTDNNGNQSTANATVKVEDNVDPNAIAQDITVQLDATGNVSIVPGDIDNDTTPSNDACGIQGLSLDVTAFGCGDVGDNPVVLTVTDNNGNQSTANATVKVEDNVDPNAIAQDITVQLDATGNVSIVPGDIDNDATPSNDACGIQSLALDITAFDCDDVGPNPVILMVTDVNGNVSTAQATVTVIDSIDPVIVGENNNLTINFDAGSGAPASYTEDGVTFLSLYGSSSHVHLGDNDGDGSNDISNHDSCCSTPYRLTVGSGVEFTLASMEVKAISGSPYFEVYPNGPTVNVTQTGTFNFPASFANATEIRWHQNSGRMTIDNMVVSTETTGSCPSDIVVESDTENCGSNVTYSASATDNCTASVTFSPPSGSFFEIGTHTVTLTVSDSSNNTTSCQFTVTVEDNVLPNALAQDVTVQLDATGNVSIVPGDIDNDTTPSNDACGIQGLSLDVTAFGCGDVGDNPVVLTVTDNNGNQSTANATVTVEDNVDPNAIAQDITVQLDATGNVSIVPGDIDNDTTPSNDACGIQGLSLDVTAFGCGDVGDNPVILTVTDNNGNQSTANATVKVEDNVDPNAIAQDITVQLDATGNVSIVPGDIDNDTTPSNDACGIQGLSLDVTAFGCGDVGDNPVVLTVTDNNGNQSTANATVTVEDNVDPNITCASDKERYLDPYQTYYSTQGNEFDATATDACGIQSLLYEEVGTTNSGSSVADLQLSLGAHDIKWTATDNNGNTSSCNTVVTVVKRPTSIVYSGDFEEQYSDQVTLSATLTDDDLGIGIEGKTVKFTIGSESVTATTDENGVASTTMILTQDPAELYTVETEFVEDDTYLGSSDSDSFDITQENAVIEYTGQTLQATNSSRDSEATIRLSANIQDITANTLYNLYDSYAGDITNAMVKFVDREGTFDSGWIPIVQLIDPLTGTVNYDWTVNIGNADSESFSIGIIVDNGYYLRNSSEDDTVVTVYVPVGDFITGGGYIIPTDSYGEMASTTGLKTNFGFNVKYNKRGTKLQGHMNVIFRRMESDGIIHVYQIKSNSTQSLGVDTNAENGTAQFATFTTKSNLRDITDPDNPISLGGNLLLKVDMTDRGEPGVDDSISFSLTDGDGALLYSSNWTGIITEEMKLGGGNLVVHSGYSKGDSVDTTSDPKNGKSARISINAVDDLIEIKSWPNPSDGHFNIKLKSPLENEASLQVFDINNRLVHSKTILANKDYKFGEELQSGVYIVNVTQGSVVKTLRAVKY